MAEPAVKQENNAGIPKQVLEAASMAEDLHNKMFGGETPESKEGEQPTPKEAEKTGEKPPVEATPPKEGDTPTEAPKVEPKAAEPEPDDPEARYQALLKEHETLTQKHKTLEGKYNKEVPHNASRADRLANELAEFKGQVMERLGRLASGEQVSQQQHSEEDQALLDKANALETQYGGEYTDMLRAFMLREIKPLLRETVQPMEETVSTVQDAQALATEQAFIQAVNKNLESEAPWVEDWVNEGSNAEFEAFLDQPDPSGLYTNRQLADIYNENHDGARFAKLLGQFYKTEVTPEKKDPATPATDPPAKPAEQAKPQEKPPAKQPTAQQQHMIEPDASSPAVQPNTDGDKIIWTQETMDAFYAKDRKNGYSEEESQRLWNDLLMAPAEGRIQSRQISQ